MQFSLLICGLKNADRLKIREYINTQIDRNNTVTKNKQTNTQTKMLSVKND